MVGVRGKRLTASRCSLYFMPLRRPKRSDHTLRAAPGHSLRKASFVKSEEVGEFSSEAQWSSCPGVPDRSRPARPIGVRTIWLHVTLILARRAASGKVGLHQ